MTNHEIGEEFEIFVIENIFKREHFELLFRSVSFRKGIFPKCNLNPDIHLKCLNTNIDFWIECKFTTKTKKEYEIKEKQMIRYYDIKKPVFYLFGFGNEPSKPNKLSLIPLGRMRRFVDINRIENHLIQRTNFKNFNELLEFTLKKPLNEDI